ncbi:MAG: segregation/condensation protein A [Schwartzia sp.]|nr:segregation/condensation protein A [Schwartzia sp. (in: firmicutes)]
MEKYEVRLDVFEGPMDLLMHLIEKNKIDIYDIPISKLTEQYLDYLTQMRKFDIEIASEFLVMAATLLLIKSSMMLPKVRQEEEVAEEDPRQELLERILEYQQFKQVSAVLEDKAEVQSRFFSREPIELPTKHIPPENLSVTELWDAFRRLIAVRKELTIPNVIVAQEEYRIEDQMLRILTLLSEAPDGEIRFESVFVSGLRSELIASFLALLELIRRHRVVVRQNMLFASIMICIRKDWTPELEREEESYVFE